MFYNTQNLNNNIKRTQIEIQNNNFNNNIPNNNANHSNKNNNIFNLNMSNLNPSPNIKNVENPKNQNLYEEAKEKQIKEIEKELENIWQDRFLAQNAFDKCLQLLRCAYINNYKDVNDYFKKTENSLEILKIKTKKLINKAKELINFAQNLKYKKDLKDLFEEYITQLNWDDFNLTMQEIIEIMNKVLQIKHKALNKILKNSNHNAKIIEKKLKENTTKLIKFCTDFNPYLMELSNNFTNIKLSEESYILETFETFNKTLEIREKMLEYIKSNILNLENELKTVNNIHNNDDNSKNIVADENNEKNMQNILDKEIKEKSDEEKAKKEELNEDEEPEVKLTKKEEQKLIDPKIGIDYYTKDILNFMKKNKIEEKRIEKEKNKLNEIAGYAIYYFGHFAPDASRGLDGADEEFKINLEYLMNIYTNEPNEVEKMLDITTKSYSKLKNETEKYVKFAKNLKYKNQILNQTNIGENINDKIKSTIKLKKQINELKNRILEKIKNSSSNNQKTKEFEKKLKNMTATLMNNFDESVFNLIKTVEESKNIKDENKKIDKLLDTDYFTVLELNQKTINYLSSIFDDYKNLNL